MMMRTQNIHFIFGEGEVSFSLDFVLVVVVAAERQFRFAFVLADLQKRHHRCEVVYRTILSIDEE